MWSVMNKIFPATSKTKTTAHYEKYWLSNESFKHTGVKMPKNLLKSAVMIDKKSTWTTMHNNLRLSTVLLFIPSEVAYNEGEYLLKWHNISM